MLLVESLDCWRESVVQLTWTSVTCWRVCVCANASGVTVTPLERVYVLVASRVQTNHCWRESVCWPLVPFKVTTGESV